MFFEGFLLVLVRSLVVVNVGLVLSQSDGLCGSVKCLVLVWCFVG